MTCNSDFINQKYEECAKHFDKWEIVKDCTDQVIDMALNLRQSGHPGGSRSKVHALVATLLSGAMKWDIRKPDKTFADRFILSGGHTVPMIYAVMSVLSDAMRTKYKQTGDKKYFVPDNKVVLPEDILEFRNHGGLPGHAEMAGKTLFLKFNTGPSGHGAPGSAGAALALKMSGAKGVKVISFEGEGGLTPGCVHETMNSAWGLGLDNLYFVIDWNDYGIDGHRTSDVVYGTPTDWFGSHGWRVTQSDNGSDWAPLTKMMVELYWGENHDKVPNIGWMKTQKGRGYYKYDNASHGAPHATNSDLYWQTKKDFADKYEVSFDGFGQGAPESKEALKEQTWNNLNKALDVLRNNQEALDYVCDTLVAIGDSVPECIDTVAVKDDKNPLNDENIWDYKNYPEEVWAKPGSQSPNRAGLANFGAYVNTYCKENYGRPLFVVSSADLSDSTNISGFAKDFKDKKGCGWYHRDDNHLGALLPQEITEFANAGIAVGMSSVNFALDPYKDFSGFYTATSTYGSFSYLKYGMMRLYSQLAQDCDFKVGKTIWISGHSGPETAEDSRTHFGVFSPAVSKLFPKGHVLNLFPWEHNEVPVVLAEAMKTDVPIIALHLTRPPIEIPDREKLGMASHFEAAKGAYLIRDYKEGKKHGVVFVQGTSTTANILKILPELDAKGINVKIVAAISHELFKMQDKDYQEKIVSNKEWLDSMVVTNGSREIVTDWTSNKISEAYTVSSDWDNKWRSGGSIEEVCEEAHISAEWILKGIEKFVNERDQRLNTIRENIPE
ncbi:MAG: transketolase [Pseudomonadota bacterium]